MNVFKYKNCNKHKTDMTIRLYIIPNTMRAKWDVKLHVFIIIMSQQADKMLEIYLEGRKELYM